MELVSRCAFALILTLALGCWNRREALLEARPSKGRGAKGDENGKATGGDCRIGCVDFDATEEGRAASGRCASFFPAIFFAAERGEGREFVTLADRSVPYSARFVFMSAVDGNPVQDESACSWKKELRTLTYVHIHKNGGTSIARALAQAADGVMGGFEQVQYDRAKQLKIRRKRFVHDHVSLMRVLSTWQNNGTGASHDRSSNKHLIFSFVRDPVERFLSSTGQVLHQHQHKLLRGCRKRTTANMLSCVIQRVRAGPRWDYYNEHFMPQAFELYHFSAGFDLEVRLLHMLLLPHFLAEVGDDPNARARSAVRPEYTGGFNLSLSDLSPEMVRDVCLLYEIDVVMLHSLGMSTRCDDIEE